MLSRSPLSSAHIKQNVRVSLGDQVQDFIKNSVRKTCACCLTDGGSHRRVFKVSLNLKERLVPVCFSWETQPNYCSTVKETVPYNEGTRLVDFIDLVILDFLMGKSLVTVSRLKGQTHFFLKPAQAVPEVLAPAQLETWQKSVFIYNRDCLK